MRFRLPNQLYAHDYRRSLGRATVALAIGFIACLVLLSGI